MFKTAEILKKENFEKEDVCVLSTGANYVAGNERAVAIKKKLKTFYIP